MLDKIYTAQPSFANGWWVVSKDIDGYATLDESTDGGFEEETARRIAASWNYCRRMTIEQLEKAIEYDY
jgi:hypothetical protein